MKTKREIVENWLPRYTGLPLDKFGKYILLTNFQNYVDRFAEWQGVEVVGHPVSEDLAHMATPLTPFHSDFLKANPDVLMQGNMESIDKFDKFMFRLSNGQYRLPTLFKKYLKLNAKFLCFNVDPDFNDTLDSLLFLTFTDFPEDEVMPLFRDSSDEEKEIVRKRFGYI